jgi:hypothetical protein
LAHKRRLCRQARDKLAQPRGALSHELGDIDPQRIVLHLDRLVELEDLAIQVEPQAGERLRVTFEELRRLAARHAVERGHPLLPVEQQLHDAGGQGAIATMGGCF